MSSRDDFTNLTYRWLKNEELTPPEEQFVVEYLLRYLKAKPVDDYRLPDIIDWKFTGDNIIFNQNYFTIPVGQINTNYYSDIALTGTGTIFLNCIHVSSDYVYAGGRFQTIGGTSSNLIARLNRTTLLWEAMTGLDYGIPTVVNDVTVASDGTIYICGAFTISSSQYYFAKWDGSTWQGISGFNGTCYALYPDASGNVYLGGGFTNVGDANGDAIVMYDGSSFSSLDQGLAGEVYGIDADSSGDIYAVGFITQIKNGSVTVENVVKYSGGAWAELGGGLGDDGSNYLECIEIDSSDTVYVGGFFSPYVWKFSGSGWVGLGGGANDDVRGMVVDSNDNLIVVGKFTSPGAKIAKYVPGQGWYSMNSSLTTQQRDVDLDANDVLYVGGFV